MKLYLAGAESTWVAALPGLKNVNVMYSYYHGRKRISELMAMARKYRWGTFVDSGAFSAFTSGVEVDLQEYIEFCHQWKDRFDVIASLDVIGDWKKTAENHQVMRKEGIESIPTFHIGEPYSALRRMVQDDEYIALGIAGRQSERSLMFNWLTKCFSIIAHERPKCRVHGFALTGFDVMDSFPWYSVDSSSWIQLSRYAKIAVHKKDGLSIYGREDREWLQDNMKYTLTVPDNLEELFIPRKGSSQQGMALRRHNARCFLEMSERIGTDPTEKGKAKQVIMPFALQ